MAHNTLTPVLMYHGVHTRDSGPGAYNSIYSVSPAAFDEQLRRLKDEGYQARLLDEFPCSGPSVLLTFDDGDRSNYQIVFPRLQQYGFLARFFVTSEWIDRSEYMTRGMLRELHSAGMGIGSHGHTHRYLSTLDSSELQGELRNSRRILEDILGEPVDSIALPGGRGGRRVLDASFASGYKSVYTSRFGYLNKSSSRHPATVPRIPIVNATSRPEFCRILDGDLWLRLSKKARQAVLLGLRGMLGEAGYSKLRQTVLRN